MTKHRSTLIVSALVLAFSSALVGCSGSDDDEPAGSGGSGGSGGKASGGSGNSGKGGATSGKGGASGKGGTSSGKGGSNGDAGAGASDAEGGDGPGVGAGGSGSGENPLMGQNGIAVTHNGTAMVCTMNVTHDGQGQDAIAMGVRAECEGGAAWHIAFPKEPGTYPCGTWSPNAANSYSDDMNAYISTTTKTSLSDPDNGGACTVTVLNTTNTISGTFSGMLKPLLSAPEPITNGHFFCGRIGTTDADWYCE